MSEPAAIDPPPFGVVGKVGGLGKVGKWGKIGMIGGMGTLRGAGKGASMRAGKAVGHR